MRELALLQTALPLGMMAWLALGQPATRPEFALRSMAAWLLLLGIALAGIWLALPWRTWQLLALLMLLGTAIGIVRLGRRKAYGRTGIVRTLSGYLALAGALTLGAWLVVPAVAGRQQPARTIDLAFPFRSGAWLVANGGSTERVNAHFMTLRPAYAKWRGQSYAVDLIRVDGLGFRTRKRRLLGLPQNPADYLSFGEPVFAPCRGRVGAAEGNRDDMQVPKRDRAHLLGNYVLMDCSGNWVLLGHFRKGSLLVAPGDEIGRGQLLGSVGNSGNSDEPHLHIHLQELGDRVFDGTPHYLTFDRTFPARNMILRCRAECRAKPLKSRLLLLAKSIIAAALIPRRVEPDKTLEQQSLAITMAGRYPRGVARLR